MICVIALVVFGILGIFSATHRKVALEAFDCVFRRVTLRKCETGLDKRLKSQITGKLMIKRPKLARFTFRHFEAISWFFTIIFIVSIIYTGIGGYNYYLYGNCNGPNEDGFCIFDPLGSNSKFSETQNEASCSVEPQTQEILSLANINLKTFPKIDRNAENDVVFIGCYVCPFTRDSYPTIKKLLDRQDVNFAFAHLPVKEDTYFISNILNCINEVDSKKFIEFNDELFSTDTSALKNENELLKVVESIGLDKESIKQCSNTERIQSMTQLQISEIQKTGIYGTPTVFVNGGAVVGPKPYRVYKRLLK
ncbi:thioredoxin domain-containing protein [Candidatus Woesearchaeota archaeon]|nr:thioredoxin domain-containing protein [Candidatus Woesearchaeota archaeon]